ncbi:MAG: thiamine phosphate synthase [Rhizobiales bacterium]|nr:thiamine phosphate synthase [Hyphomicrobiales bacterium]
MTVDLSLYVLVDPERSRGRPLAELAAEAAAGGATLIQYRDKLASTARMVETAHAIRIALTGSGVPLLINDRVDVALASGADGVHVGQDDMGVADARRLLGDEAIIGLTIRSAEEAEAAAVELIDYACIGGVFATGSKDNAGAPIGIGGFAGIRQVFTRRWPRLPVGAIAGIDATNAAALARAGADGVAVMSAVTLAEDPRAAAAALKAAFVAGRPEPRPSRSDQP